MSYRSYSKRKTPVVSDTTASDLFDELISGKGLKSKSNASPTKPVPSEPKPRSKVCVTSAPKEYSSSKMRKIDTEEPKEVSSWSKRKYQYSFLPRSDNSSLTSRSSVVDTPHSKSPANSKMAVFDIIDGEEEETSPLQKPAVKHTKVQRSRAPKSVGSTSATKVSTKPRSRSGAKNTSAPSAPMPVKAKTRSNSNSKSNSKVVKSRRVVSKVNSSDDVFAASLADPDANGCSPHLDNSQESLPGGLETHSQKSSSVMSKSESSFVDLDSTNQTECTSSGLPDSQDAPSPHTLTHPTTSTATCVSTKRAKRLNSTGKNSSAAKRPRLNNTEQPKNGTKVKGERSKWSKGGVVSEIATRTRSNSRVEEVVKSPLDELLESPFKKHCADPTSGKDKDSAQGYTAPLYRRPNIKIASPIKENNPRSNSNSGWATKSKTSKERCVQQDVPSLKKASLYPHNTLSVPSLKRTTSWPRQHPSPHTLPVVGKPGVAGVSKSPRKYSYFNQTAQKDDTKEEERPQRQYSYLHTVTVTPGDNSGRVENVHVKGRTSVVQKSGQEPTRVRNVRQAHECLEVGENQEFFDEVRYLLGSIKPSAPLKSRCLGTLNLAEQFLKPEFSQQLRSQGFTSKIMALLKDCPQYPTLCLCTAVLFYTITRDKLNSDWSNDLIKVLLSMLSMTSWTLDSDPKVEREMLKMCMKAKVVLRKTVAKETVAKDADLMGGSQEEKENEFQSSEPPDFDIDPDNFTISQLARETITSLTAPHHKPKALGNQLRVVGALDQLANMVIEGCDSVGDLGPAHLLSGCGLDSADLQKLDTLERCLKALENCTLMNSDNQSYLVVFDGSLLISRLVKLIKTCFTLLPEVGPSPSTHTLCHTLLAVFKLLLNMTHDNELGCDRVGREEAVMDVLLDCVLKLPGSLSDGQQFDILASALGVLINLTEHSGSNRRQLELTKVKGHDEETKEIDELLKMQKDIGFHGEDSSLRALVELFLKHYKKAESASIAVPSPQRLSQLSSSPHHTPTKSARGQGSTPVRRDLSLTFANRLKATRSPQKGHSQNSQNSQEPDSQNSQGSEGFDWLPSNSAESDESEEEEDYETIQTDPMVYSREEFDTALHQAGRHLEDSVIASYTALLVGILVKHNCDCVELVRECLPSGSFSEMIGMLKKFVSFMNLTGSTTGLESMRHIIRYLEEL